MQMCIETKSLPQVGLDLDLSSQLMLHIGLQQLLLLDDLQRNNKLTSALASEIDSAEFAAAERLADLEVTKGPASGLPKNE